MITVWQVASTPFWAAATYMFVLSAAPIFNPRPNSNEKIMNRLLVAGVLAYIAARICA